MRQEITTILTIFNESDVIKCDTNGDGIEGPLRFLIQSRFFMNCECTGW